MNVKKGFTIAKVLKKSWLWLAFFLLIVALRLIFPADNKLFEQQAQLAMRAIGDELLRFNQDFDTPVQPVEKVDPKTLRLKFAEPILIDPDKLSAFALEVIHPEITAHSIVNVIDTASKLVVYGFEIDRRNPKEIPCIGRLLPKSHYYIDVSFYDKSVLPLSSKTALEGLLGASLLFVLALVIWPFLSLQRKEPIVEDKDRIAIKGAQLDFRANEILLKDKCIKLTSKEAEILKILVDHEGQLVSRDYLTQEVWLKKGVVTGRSLDMYISRLRKKIKDLPNAQILNKHGKGYILNV